MKKKLLLFVLAFTVVNLSVNAQSTDEDRKTDAKNVIKLGFGKSALLMSRTVMDYEHAAGILPISFERVITGNLSVELGGNIGMKFLTQKENETLEKSKAKIDANLIFGAGIALKYYFYGDAPTGVYLSPFFDFSNVDFKTKIQNIAASKTQATIYDAGLNIGYQFIIAGNISLDITAGIMHKHSTTESELTPPAALAAAIAANETTATVTKTTKTAKQIEPSVSLSLGYSF
ncbi:DUF3575 domain-containing protein [Ichthyobacterium seriolicida]|uniref:Outer membrane protein beta-barrel domain-containing protein n=1 Tax=Ichthyobacterium seriolicida TaxID=242600 RepID=A0A1J1E1C8_9FLAO|nr:DUF3575 domain-containing protein [Ichthyobacterium seriolicida]BAV94749.1 hypothetical protein JBKA6_0736 [Ichthyobacterium seriolicida]